MLFFKTENFSKYLKYSLRLLFVQTIFISSLSCYTASSAAATTGSWTKVADENGGFTLSSTRLVRYGAGSSWIERSLSGTVSCSNATFGDPIAGVAKECDLLDQPAASGSWTKVADENGSFTLSSTRLVRYGAGSSWIERSLSGTVSCSNATFGDPISGTQKECDLRDQASLAPIISSGVQSHPRILGNATSFQFVAIEARKEGSATNKLYKAVKAFSDSLTAATIDKATGRLVYTVDLLKPTLDYFGRPVLLTNARDLLARIYSLGLTYQIETDDTLKTVYFNRAWAELARWAGVDGSGLVTTWNPSHFLDVAELSHAVGVGYDLFFYAMSSNQRDQLASALKTRAFDEALLNQYSNNSEQAWPNAKKSNWNSVCNSGLGIAALAVYDNPITASTAASILTKSLYSIQNSLGSYSTAGGWEEGVGYWNYATLYAVSYINALKNSFNSDFGLLSFANFRKSGDFALALTGPTLKVFNYGDTGEYLSAPQLFALSKWNNKTSLASLQNAYNDKDTSTNIYWFLKPLEILNRFDSVSLNDISDTKNAYFPREEIVTLRSSWGSDASYAAMKGGFVGADHGTMNIGTFIYEVYGERFIWQVGQENYALPGYWNFGQTEKRWNYYRTRAEGNNTLVLNASADGGQDVTKSAAVIGTNLTSTTAARAVLDMTSVYSRQASTLKRGMRLFLANAEDGSTPKGLVIQDELTLKSAGTISWFAHTKAVITQGIDRSRATLTINGKKIEARVTSPAGATLKILDAVGDAKSAVYIPATPSSPIPASNAAFKKLAVELAVSAGVPQTIRVQFAPYNSTGASPWHSVQEPLANW